MMSRYRHGATVLLVLTSTFSFIDAVALPSFSKRFPFFRSKRQSAYTPLIFFTVPPGLSAECDAMEKVVRGVEKDLGVVVQRLDILRDPASEAVLNAILSPQGASVTPPLLYHRESRQTIHVSPPVTTTKSASGNAGDSSAKAASASRRTIAIDPDRVRAWAKGRYLAPSKAETMTGTAIIAPQGTMIDRGDDNADDLDAEMMEQAEQLTDMSLTPEQRLGKRRMEERTRAKAATATSNS
jgi:hypothetical protein